ncbi:hypothetical protein CDL12_17242 [Handroanthus impetiginosus]|uniref:PB1-like domain-containing protein n=1 Tax=Handroanthus impetiginosus TaxID=429701 RepID=A0A2G9GY30_9LAMI|nr:hypothetical protein CDL12_17242 [Handroanthus impetiginosus]
MLLDASENTDFFIVRMHHGGTFVYFGTPSYLGGQVSHIDFYSPDKMLLIEMHSMAVEIGLKGDDDTNGLSLLKDDMYALNLSNFIDENRMIESVGELSKGFYNSMDDRQGTIGENERLEFIGEKDNTMGGENRKSAGMNDDKDDEPVRTNPDVINTNNSKYSEKLFDSDCDVSNDDVLFESKIDLEVESGWLPSEQQ